VTAFDETGSEPRHEPPGPMPHPRRWPVAAAALVVAVLAVVGAIVWVRHSDGASASPPSAAATAGPSPSGFEIGVGGVRMWLPAGWVRVTPSSVMLTRAADSFQHDKPRLASQLRAFAANRGLERFALFAAAPNGGNVTVLVTPWTGSSSSRITGALRMQLIAAGARHLRASDVSVAATSGRRIDYTLPFTRPDGGTTDVPESLYAAVVGDRLAIVTITAPPAGTDVATMADSLRLQ
jgi:hypothetical protein